MYKTMQREMSRQIDELGAELNNKQVALGNVEHFLTTNN